MRVVWTTADPAALAQHLGDTLGVAIDTLAGVPAILFPGGSILLGHDEGAAGARAGAVAAQSGRLRLELGSLDEPADRTRPTHPGGLVDLVGVGWATVELDRAIREFAPLRFGPTVSDGSLGARARVGRVGTGSLVLLEPSTEGRLTAALARFGEGATAVYLAAAPGGLESLAARFRRTGERARIAGGPFGRSFVVGASPWGPHLVVCEAIGPLDPAGPQGGTIVP
jgi:hypothetical protein